MGSGNWSHYSFGGCMEKHELRSRWVKMLSRCEDQGNASYKDYGARGIKVCKDWHNYDNFYKWCISNGAKPDLFLDRIDNDGDYKPSNCKFSTRKENNNNKSNNFNITAFGETKTLAQWSEDKRCKIAVRTLWKRLSLGWDPEEAISSPAGQAGRKYKPKKDSKFYKAFGESKTLFQWAKDDRCKPSYKMLWQRVEQLGWDIEEAIKKPVKTLSK